MGVVGTVNFVLRSVSFLSVLGWGLLGTGIDDADLVLWGILLAPVLVLRDELAAFPMTGFPLGAGNLEKDPDLFIFPDCCWLVPDLRVFFASTSVLKIKTKKETYTVFQFS